MDLKSINSESRALVAEGLYRSLLTLALLVAGFKAFPDHVVVVATATLLVAAGIRAILLNQELSDHVARRGAWIEQLTVRFALIELHNMALNQESIDRDWSGPLPVWKEARENALADLEGFDIDRDVATGFSTFGNLKAKGAGLLHFALTIVGDILCVGLALILAG